MSQIALALGLIGVFWLGFYIRTLKDAISKLKPLIEPRNEEESKATIIDGDDIIQMAKFEEQERIRKLNVPVSRQ